MNTYIVIPHISDTRLHVKADTLQGLFLASLYGMNKILIKNFNKLRVQYPVEEKIEITSSNITILLIDFLSEILTHSQIKKAIFREVIFEKFSDNNLKATIRGIKIKSFDEDIKAVTYHEAKIVKNKKGNYEVTIIFDV